LDRRSGPKETSRAHIGRKERKKGKKGRPFEDEKREGGGGSKSVGEPFGQRRGGGKGGGAITP